MAKAKTPKLEEPKGRRWHAKFSEDGMNALIGDESSVAAMGKTGEFLLPTFQANVRLVAASGDLFDAAVAAEKVMAAFAVEGGVVSGARLDRAIKGLRQAIAYARTGEITDEMKKAETKRLGLKR